MRQWLVQFGEMTVAMFVGMAVGGIARGVLAAAGLASVFTPELAYLWMTGWMALGMFVAMRWRGHDARMSTEMLAASLAPMILCLILVESGVCPFVPFLTWLTFQTLHAAGMAGMMIAMIAYMLYRRDMYSAPVGNHAHAAPHVPAG